MNRKLPKIFQNQNANLVTNNDKVYYSMYQGKSIVEETRSNQDSVLEEIQTFFDENRYVYTKDVLIETYDKTYDTRLAKLGDGFLLTLDNVKIPLSSIVSFQIKSR